MYVCAWQQLGHIYWILRFYTNYSVSKKNLPPLKFSDIFPKRLGIFSPNFTHLLHVLDNSARTLEYKFLLNYLQL